MNDLDLERLRVPTVGATRLPVVVRRQDEQDIPVCFDGWLRSYRDSRFASRVSSEQYWFFHHQLIEGLWIDPTCAWLIACNPEHPGQVFGFVCGQRAETLSGSALVVHYTWVKRDFRRFGLATRLLATLDTREVPGAIVSTHDTAMGREWLKGAGIANVYNPYLVLARAPVPRPELRGRNGRQMRRQTDALITHRRNTTRGGYVPGSVVEGGEE